MDRREVRVPAETLTITIPPFTTSEHPFFHEDNVTVKVVCESDLYGFEVSEDDCMKRVYVSGFKKDGKGTKGHKSCNTISSSKRVTRRKCLGAYITAIDDEEILMMDQAKEKFAELRSKKVDSFTMILAGEPKPSKSMTQRAYDKLELPDFDLDHNLGEDCFASGDDLEEDSSMTTSQKTNEFGTDYVPTIGTKINKDFGSKGFFEGEVVSGPHSCTVKGDNIVVWKVRYRDGDREEMTASEIAYWKAPVEEVRASKTKSKSKPTRPKKTVATKPSGDQSEELKDALPKLGKDASAPTHLRRSTRLQQQALETARINFLDSNPCLPMDSIGMYDAATCWIHLCDDDPYKELLHNVNEVETLPQDPVALTAIHRLLDPDADLDKLRVSALQAEAISPEERALPRFSRQALKRLPTWSLWHKNELEKLDQMKALGMFGSPIKLPEGGILMRFHWQYQIKVNGKQQSRLCCDGSPRGTPEVHSTTNTYALCLEHPVFRLFIALCAADNLTIYGDAKDAFAHSPGPSMPTFMKLDDAFCDWHLEQTGVLLDKDLVLPVLRALQGHPEAARLWEEHISAILKDVRFKNATHKKNIYTGKFCGEKVLLVRQVNDFALGCRQESTAKSVYSKIRAKLTLHNEAEAPFEYLGLVNSFDGYDVLQTRDYVKLSAESYIRHLLEAHGWDNPSLRELSNKPKPPLHESDVANLFNLAARPVENTPKHKALEKEQGFGYRSVLGEILFAYILCRPDIGYAVTTLAKFSTAPNALHYKSLKHLAIYLRQTQDWGIMYWRSEPVASLPEVPYVPMKFDDCLPIIPPPMHLHQLLT